MLEFHVSPTLNEAMRKLYASELLRPPDFKNPAMEIFLEVCTCAGRATRKGNGPVADHGGDSHNLNLQAADWTATKSEQQGMKQTQGEGRVFRG